MAFAPCSVHGGGFKGGASTFFPALVKGGERTSARLKTCTSCGDTLHEWATKRLSLVSEGDTFYPQLQATSCCNCQGPLKGPWGFFLSEYMRGQPERQFYGQVCQDCAAAVQSDWSIP